MLTFLVRQIKPTQLAFRRTIDLDRRNVRRVRGIPRTIFGQKLRPCKCTRIYLLTYIAELGTIQNLRSSLLVGLRQSRNACCSCYECIMCLYRYVGHVLEDVHVPGSGPIWLDDFACPRRSRSQCNTDLDQCPHSDWGVHDCTHYEDVSIACYARPHTTYRPYYRPWYDCAFITIRDVNKTLITQDQYKDCFCLQGAWRRSPH